MVLLFVFLKAYPQCNAVIGTSIDPPEGCDLFGIQFSDQSQGTISRLWNFGDGSPTTTAQNPSKTFTTGERDTTYIVTLTINCVSGSSTATIPVKVFARPRVDFGANKASVCAITDSVCFTNSSDKGPGYSYLWNFGDGTISDKMESCKIYSTPGFYDVSLTVINDKGCLGTKAVSNFMKVEQIPSTAFSVNAYSGCSPFNVILKNTTDTLASDYKNWTWDFGNGEFYFGFEPPVQTYTKAGEYTITLGTTNSLGCFNYSTQKITVKPSPVARFNASSPVCQNENLMVQYSGNASDSASYTWSFDSATDITGSGSGPYNLLWQEPGNKTISLTVNDNGCSSTVSEKVQVTPITRVFLNVSASHDTICSEESVTFTASPVNYDNYSFYVNSTLVQQSRLNTYTGKGFADKDRIYVKITDVNGCTEVISDTLTITVTQSPVVSLTSSALTDTICFGEQVVFEAIPAGYNEYSFYLANELVQTGSNSVFATSMLTDRDRVYVEARYNDCISKKSNNIITTVKEPLAAPMVYCGATSVGSIEFLWDELPGAIAYEVSIDNAPFQAPSSGTAGLSHLITGLSSNETRSIRVRASDASICGTGLISIPQTCAAIDCPPVLFDLVAPVRNVCLDEEVILAVEGITIPNYSIHWNNEPANNSLTYTISAVNDMQVPVSLINNQYPLCPAVEKHFQINTTARPQLTLESSNIMNPVLEGTSISFTAFPGNLKTYSFYVNNKLEQEGPDNIFRVANPVNGRYVHVLSSLNGCNVTAGPVAMNVVSPLEIPQVNFVFSDENHVVFEWDAIPGAIGYIVSVNNGPFIEPSGGPTGLRHIISGLKPGEAVTISVIAVGTEITGNSEASQPAIGYAETCNAFYYSILTNHTICKGDTLVLQINGLNLSNYEVAWGGAPPTQAKSLVVFPESDTVVSLAIKNLDTPFCPRQISYIFIKVNDRPEPLVLSSSNTDNDVCSGDLVLFTVSPAGYDYYEFYRGDNLLSGSYLNTYETRTLNDGFAIRAKAYNQGCESAFSNEIINTVKPPLSIPQINCGESDFESLSFVWDTIPDALGYALSINGSSFISPSSGLTGIVHEINGLTAGDSVRASIMTLGNAPCGNSLPSVSVTCYARECENISYLLDPYKTICGGETINLDISNINIADYAVSWNDGPYGSNTSVQLTGIKDTLIYVSVRNNALPQCPASKRYFEIKVEEMPSVQLISSSSRDTVCSGETVRFRVSPADFDRYLFFNKGTVVQDSPSSHYTPVNLTNSHSIYSEVYKNGCILRSDTIETYIRPPVMLNLTANESGSLCQGKALEFTATPGFKTYYFTDTESVLHETTENMVSLNVNHSNLTVFAVDESDCVTVGSDTLTFEILPLPRVSINSSVDTICYSDFASYFAEPEGFADYRFYRNGTDLMQSGISGIYTTDSLRAGEKISVIAVDDKGCASLPSVSSFPYLHPYPVSWIDSETDGLCLNDSISLYAITDNLFTGASYLWSTGATGSSIRVSPAYNTLYSLLYSDSRCTFKVIDSKYIIVDRQAPPVAYAGEDVTICINDSIQLEASGGMNFIWDNILTLDNPFISNPFARPTTTTQYTVTVSNKFCRSHDTVTVFIDLCLAGLTDPIPQIITPNNDGFNDTWHIQNIDYFENNSLEIFNRWGNHIYKAAPYDNSWDGRNNKGVELPAGTYFYILNLGNGSKPVNGYIILHR